MFSLLDQQEFRVFVWAVVTVVAILAAWGDIRSYRIPNTLTISVLLSGIAWSIISSGWKGILDSITAIFILSLPFIILFIFAGGGAGDAKLMGALGAWLGIVDGLVTLIAVIMMGAVLGLLYALFRGKFYDVLWRAKFMLLSVLGKLRLSSLPKPGPVNRNEMISMPYGVAIVSGVLSAGIYTWLSAEHIVC